MSIRRLVAPLAVTALLVAIPVAALADDGAAVFKKNCAKCHGEDGLGQTTLGKAAKVPSMKDPKVSDKTLEEVVKFVKENKKHDKFIHKLTDADIEAAAAYAQMLAKQP